MKFQGKYNFVPDPPEKMAGKSRVETAGYISAQKRIENMILAGQRLVNARQEMYDAGVEVDPDLVKMDPTRAKNFDLVDAQRAAEKAQEALDKAQEYLRQKSKEAEIKPPVKDPVQSGRVPEAGQ